MADREKVIKGLGETLQVLGNHVPERYLGYSAGACLDAIALLKAQEPTECENTNKARIFCCSVCGYEVADIFIDEQRFKYPSINFCPNCGRKVKLE